MKIAYKKRRLNLNLILGLVWLTLFFIGIFVKNETNWIDYGWIVISSMYLGIYFYQRKYKYLSVQNGIIKVNRPFGKKIKLSEIKRIKKFAGDYILKTKNKKLTINTKMIERSSLAKLNTELEKLNVEWD